MDAQEFYFRFSWLPVTEDTDEAPFVYGFLADLVEANNPHILGLNNSNLPRYSSISGIRGVGETGCWCDRVLVRQVIGETGCW
jgi:hypothetical protein